LAENFKTRLMAFVAMSQMYISLKPILRWSQRCPPKNQLELIEQQYDSILRSSFNQEAFFFTSYASYQFLGSLFRKLARNLAVYLEAHTHVNRLFHVWNKTNRSSVQESPMYTCMMWCELTFQIRNQMFILLLGKGRSMFHINKVSLWYFLL
jgi:hypothetical protein